jgi:hypothetical protein
MTWKLIIAKLAQRQLERVPRGDQATLLDALEAMRRSPESAFGVAPRVLEAGIIVRALEGGSGHDGTSDGAPSRGYPRR